jgi:hypothetical protein
MIDYLCALFVGDSVKRRSRRIIRYYAGLEWNTGRKQGEVNDKKVYTTDGGISQ